MTGHKMVVDKVTVVVLLTLEFHIQANKKAEEFHEKVPSNVRDGYDERKAVVNDNARASLSLGADKFTWAMPSIFIFLVRSAVDIAGSAGKKELKPMSMLFHLLCSCQALSHDTLQDALFGK